MVLVTTVVVAVTMVVMMAVVVMIMEANVVVMIVAAVTVAKKKRPCTYKFSADDRAVLYRPPYLSLKQNHGVDRAGIVISSGDTLRFREFASQCLLYFILFYFVF